MADVNPSPVLFVHDVSFTGADLGLYLHVPWRDDQTYVGGTARITYPGGGFQLAVIQREPSNDTRPEHAYSTHTMGYRYAPLINTMGDCTAHDAGLYSFGTYADAVAVSEAKCLSEYQDSTFSGLSLALLINGTGENLDHAIQLSGLINVAGDATNAFQGSILANLSKNYLESTLQVGLYNIGFDCDYRGWHRQIPEFFWRYEGDSLCPEDSE